MREMREGDSEAGAEDRWRQPRGQREDKEQTTNVSTQKQKSKEVLQSIEIIMKINISRHGRVDKLMLACGPLALTRTDIFQPQHVARNQREGADSSQIVYQFRQSFFR